MHFEVKLTDQHRIVAELGALQVEVDALKRLQHCSREMISLSSNSKFADALQTEVVALKRLQIETAAGKTQRL